MSTHFCPRSKSLPPVAGPLSVTVFIWGGDADDLKCPKQHRIEQIFWEMFGNFNGKLFVKLEFGVVESSPTHQNFNV